MISAFQPQGSCSWPPHLHNLGVGGHLEGQTGAEGQAYHANAAANNLRMFLQDLDGFLQEDEAAISSENQ